jgi:pimeloyl-ACP methyl ester carboxylesterase
MPSPRSAPFYAEIVETMSGAGICKPVVFGAERSMLGLLTKPSRRSAVSLPAILLPNAGLVHRVGPHRLNVRIARLLARHGFTSLRFDLKGFGDSGPRAEKLSFRKASLRDAREAMDFLKASLGIDRFIAIGLCSGADLSLALAAEDDRVAAALLIDSFAYVTRFYRLCRYSRWLIELAGWARLGKALLRQRRGGDADRSVDASRFEWGMPPRKEVLRDVEGALARGARLGFVYSGDESFYNYLVHFALAFRRHRATGRLSVQSFPEADHTFTMTHHQQSLLDYLERWTLLAAGTEEGLRLCNTSACSSEGSSSLSPSATSFPSGSAPSTPSFPPT